MDATQVLPSKEKSYKFLKGFLFILICLLLIGVIYAFYVGRKASDKTIKKLIAEEAKKYSNPVEVEKLLMQGVREIESSPIRFNQARQFAKSSGAPLEQVLVDSAISMAKNLNYID